MTDADRLPTAPAAAAAHSCKELWEKLEPQLERLDPAAARAHGVVPLLAQRLRERGLPVPATYLHEERAARMANALAPSVLEKARAAYDGRMMLLKGPEVAALYPGRARMLVDLDLLVDDAPTAREALLDAGFVSADRLEPVVDGFYHVNPVELPGVPLAIELHRSFRWPHGLGPAPNEHLFAAAVPSQVDVPRLLAPAKAHHAVLLAAHAWAERPLTRLRDLIDIALMSDGTAADELTRVADRWGWGRLWRTTQDVIGWLLNERPKPMPVRIWARHLNTLREPSAADRQATYWLSPFWSLPPRTALHIIAFFAKKALLAKGG